MIYSCMQVNVFLNPNLLLKKIQPLTFGNLRYYKKVVYHTYFCKNKIFFSDKHLWHLQNVHFLIGMLFCLCWNLYPWHRMTDWSKLILFQFFSLQVEAHFIPKCKGAGDTSNFDDYEEEPLRISSTEKCAKEFSEF